MQIFTCDQGSEEWIQARLGIPTASEFHTVMAIGKGGGESKTRRTYMLKLAGEILTGEQMDSYSNHHMERGKVMEDEARDLYAFMKDASPECVGFIRNGQKGCSPDSLVGDDGMLEIKTKLPHLQVDCLLADRLPPEHKAQCQGALWVAERQWIDFVSYWPGLPMFVFREERDEEYIAKIAAAVDEFNAELAHAVARVRRLQGQPALEAA
jgi:predicted phage-related endonuclease